MKDEQKFQSKAQLTALKIHAAWEKFENVVLFPFRYLADKCGQTDVFREKPVTRLSVVK